MWAAWLSTLNIWNKVKPLNKQRKILLKKWSLIHSNRIWQYPLSLSLSQHFPFEPGTNEGMLDINTSDGETNFFDPATQGPLLFWEIENCLKQILV